MLFVLLHSVIHFVPFDHLFQKSKFSYPSCMTIIFTKKYIFTYLFTFQTSNVVKDIWVLFDSLYYVLRGILVLPVLLHPVIHFVPFDHFSRKIKFSCSSRTSLFSPKFSSHIFFYFSNIKCSKGHLSAHCFDLYRFAPFDHFSQKTKFSYPTCTAIIPTKVFFSLFTPWT